MNLTFKHQLSLLLIVWATMLPLEADPEPITVQSDMLSLNREDNRDIFHFTGNVLVNGPDMDATCDTMDIFAEKEETLSNSPSSFGNIQLIVAQGNVVINKPEQTAKAQHAEIIPKEEKMILTGSPSIIDKDGIIEGHRITLFQNDQKAIVEGDPQGGRPTVTLPSTDKLIPKESTPLAFSDENS